MSVKMDIEGSEYNAIIGAKETIYKNSPKLAISVYHRRNDLFTLPLLIHEIEPKYRLYLRHHSNSFRETLLYAKI